MTAKSRDRLGLRLSAELRHNVSRRCDTEKCSMTDFVATAIEEKLEKDDVGDFDRKMNIQNSFRRQKEVLDIPPSVTRGLKNGTWEMTRIGNGKYKIKPRWKRVVVDSVLPQEVIEALENGTWETIRTQLGNYRIQSKSKPEIEI